MLIYTLSAALRDLDQEDLVVFELSTLISASSENDDTLVSIISHIRFLTLGAY
jgi:hypothetical protein